MKIQLLSSILFAGSITALPFLEDAVPSRTTNFPSKVRRATGEVVTGALATSVNYDDGHGSGSDKYKTYNGNGASGSFPAMSKWVNFLDMWNNNKANMLSACSDNNYGKDNTEDDIGNIWDAIATVAAETKLDHRFILAVILQESGGCVRVATTYGDAANPGLMQSEGGTASCHGEVTCSKATILQMVREGSAGTSVGDGLAANLDEAQSTYGVSGAQAYYYAARLYNSGEIDDTNDLSSSAGATSCYVSDIANRFIGWVNADKTCSL